MSDQKQLHAAGAIVALLILGFTVLDYTAAVWPLQPSEMRWRFGAISALSGSLLTPSLGVLFLFAVALLSGKRWLQLTISASLTLVALGLTGACIIFALDVLQLRGGVRPELLSQYDMGAGRSALKLAIGAVAALTLGLLSFRAWRKSPKRSKVERTAEPTLIRLGSVGVAEEQVSG